MKKLVLLLLIPLVFGCDIVKKLEDKKNDLDDLNLNGKVKSLKETTYSALDKFGEPAEVFFKSQKEYFFNKEGFYTEIKHYNEDGGLTNNWEYNYDDGNKIEEIIYYKYGKFMGKNKYKYDDKGYKIEKRIYSADGQLEIFVKVKYDKNGNRIKLNRYLENGELRDKLKYNYKDGKLIEEIGYDKDGEFEGKITYKYDDNGNMIERLFNNQIEDEKLYESPTGELIAESKLEETFGNNYQEIIDDGQLVVINRRPLSEVVKVKENFKYEKFDNNKNWLKRISYDEIGKATGVIEREIEYYD